MSNRSADLSVAAATAGADVLGESLGAQARRLLCESLIEPLSTMASSMHSFATLPLRNL